MITLRHYVRVPELKALLSERPLGEAREGQIFMLPSHANDETLMDLLRRDRSYFGEGPMIWSWQDLYRAFVPRERLRRQIDPPDHRLILRYLLNGALASFDADGRSVPGGVRGRGFLDVLSTAIRELLLERVPPDRLIGGEPPEPDGSVPSGELLHRLYTDYLFYLEEHGLADSAQLPSLAESDMDRAVARDILRETELCWVGFLSFTGAQRRLIYALDGLAPHMRFLVPDAGLPGFRDVSLQLGFTIRDATRFCGNAATISGRDAYAQYDGAAREIASLIRGTGALMKAFAGLSDVSADRADIGIQVAPGAAPLMASALRKYGVPFQLRCETSVRETAAMETARSAWEAYRAGWPLRRTLALLASPVFGLERLDQARAFSSMPEGEAAWRDFLACDARALDVFSRLAAFCAYLADPEGHTGYDLLRALFALAGEDWPARLADEARESFDMDFYVRSLASARMEMEQKIDLLAELTPPLGEAGSLRFSGPDAMAFLTDWSREASTALPPLQKGVVTVYDAPPPVLVSHTVWVMTDVDSGRYPGSVSDQALLDGEVRERVNGAEEDFLHLPTLHEKREQQEALFRRLLCAGNAGTVIARALQDERGRERGVSPFAESALADQAAWRVSAEIAVSPGVSRVSVPDRGAFPRVAASPWREKLRVSASAIDDWYECPYMYWLLRVAKVESPTDEVEMLSRPVRGSIVHKVWQEVWTRYSRGGGATLTAILREGWDDLIASNARRYPFLADPRASVVRADLRRTMLSMADLQDGIESRAAAAGLARTRTELEYRLPELEMEHAVFAGLADRLDVWEGLGAVVVDYKLGYSIDYKDSLQLACYAAMLRGAGKEEIVGFCYMGHRDGRVRGAWARDDMKDVYGDGSRKPAGFDEQVRAAYDVMRDMDAVLWGGKYAANYESKRCANCECAKVCRRTERFGAYAAAGGEESDDGGDE